MLVPEPSPSFCCQVAGFPIAFESGQEDLLLEVPPTYVPYLRERPASPECVVRVCRGQPDWASGQQVLRAPHQQLGYFQNISRHAWSIWRIRGQSWLRLEPLEPGLPAYGLQLPGPSELELRVDSSAAVLPALVYPLGTMLLLYLLWRREGVLAHCSGVEHRGRGMVFLGRSGVGKTTLASIWASVGARVLNDDRLALRVQEGQAFAHNTPMLYPQSVGQAPLRSIFFLSHGPENSLRALPPPQALPLLLANTVVHAHDPLLLAGMVENLRGLLARVPAYSFAFVPSREAARFLLDRLGWH